jgi:hypothetical protein
MTRDLGFEGCTVMMLTDFTRVALYEKKNRGDEPESKHDCQFRNTQEPGAPGGPACR